MESAKTHYTISRETGLPFGEAVEKARALLQEVGYGVLSEVDVRTELKEKLDIEREPYLVLGACNPPLATRAWTSSRSSVLSCPVQRRLRAGGPHTRSRGRA